MSKNDVIGSCEWAPKPRLADYTQQLADLSTIFYSMHVILERTRRDLEDFRYSKDEAGELMKNKDLPGIEVISALHATSPIIQSAMERNILEVEEFRERILAMSQAVEGDASRSASEESVYWTPSSDKVAWNITTPGHGDKLLDSTGENQPGETTMCTLQYHKDVLDVEFPQLFIPSQDVDFLNRSHSRRVVLHSLPHDTTIMQVLKAIRCYGGVISALVADDLASRQKSCKTALVDFVYANSATAFASELGKGRMRFQDSAQVIHFVRGYQVPTPSWYQSELNHTLLSKGATRALYLPEFPVKAIWYLISTIGIDAINCVGLQEGKDLIIEFVSLFEADQAYQLIKRGCLNVKYGASRERIRYVSDSSQGDMDDLYAMTGGLIEHIEPGFLQRKWDQEPFNMYRSTHELELCLGCPHEAGNEASVPPEKPWQEVIAEYFDIEPDQVWEFLEDRKHFRDTTYKIIGSNITLTRHKYSWSISREDNAKRLMENTLHDPVCADEWDAHFEAHGTINFRVWERYGMLAGHRRQLAAEQGLEPWIVPHCNGCKWGCRGLEMIPVPSIIQEWCTTRQVYA